MPELRFRDLAISQIKVFIRAYEEGFFTLYRDSGIWSEELIIEGYHQAALRLSQQIFENIKLYLGDKKVLGRKVKNSWLEFSFSLDQRLITVYFSENKDDKIRWIESIGIDRKPIIF
ncbi:MAG: hypothetical protein AAB453_04705 [Patescibacteria group bacterium]